MLLRFRKGLSIKLRKIFSNLGMQIVYGKFCWHVMNLFPPSVYITASHVDLRIQCFVSCQTTLDVTFNIVYSGRPLQPLQPLPASIELLPRESTASQQWGREGRMTLAIFKHESRSCKGVKSRARSSTSSTVKNYEYQVICGATCGIFLRFSLVFNGWFHHFRVCLHYISYF